eukprot:UN31591
MSTLYLRETLLRDKTKHLYSELDEIEFAQLKAVSRGNSSMGFSREVSPELSSSYVPPIITEEIIDNKELENEQKLSPNNLLLPSDNPEMISRDIYSVENILINSYNRQLTHEQDEDIDHLTPVSNGQQRSISKSDPQSPFDTDQFKIIRRTKFVYCVYFCME